jgi:hypothetical protein
MQGGPCPGRSSRTPQVASRCSWSRIRVRPRLCTPSTPVCTPPPAATCGPSAGRAFPLEHRTYAHRLRRWDDVAARGESGFRGLQPPVRRCRVGSRRRLCGRCQDFSPVVTKRAAWPSAGERRPWLHSDDRRVLYRLTSSLIGRGAAVWNLGCLSVPARAAQALRVARPDSSRERSQQYNETAQHRTP